MLLHSIRSSDRAKRYSTIKYSLAIIETLYLLLLLFLFQGLGLSMALARHLLESSTPQFLVIPVYLLIIYIAYYLLNFPFNFYHSFLLERKFSLSEQKIKDWFLDQLKAGAISYIILLILVMAFYYAQRHYLRNWWLSVSLFWIFLSLILAKLLPVVIVPLFFKYKKLRDEGLRERIMKLAKKMRIKILDVFEIDFSKKTLKANAAFLGWGSTKRVILADTLKDKYNGEELEVILAHEFAHYKLRHLLKLILLNSAVTVAFFYTLFISNQRVLGMFGLYSLWDLAALPVVFIYLVIFGIITQPLTNYISRIFERNADRLALSQAGSKKAFISAMDKLSHQNLSDRDPHPVIKFFFFDHPPIDERIRMANLHTPRP